MVAIFYLYLSLERRSLSLLIVGFIVGVCLTQMLILSSPSRLNICHTISSLDEELGTITLTAQEDYKHLWGKTKEAFKYIYAHHLNDADWFFKADDDTYAVMENMRYMLYPYSPETPIYFGCKLKPYVKQCYMSGASGYVLSKEAVRRFGRKSFTK
ncbi:unnamed protein product [Ceratitis capitata]|uniref:N-acetylgalactosaminide beta-1,3-galactosyltransferase n=1 Tax=Ceratitis capitata TaxID=7213 RepID=A0A811U0P9_CERCA|nr:unnamed protein product [Ceratitis capitata]